MAYRNLEISNRGPVRTITINRPDKLNALDRATLNELAITFTQAAQDDAVRVVVLAGAGDKAFVAGADIAAMRRFSAQQARAFSLAGQQLMLTIEQLGKPVIARLQGFALGGGMELAMACHLRIASNRAKLGQPEINLGLIPGFGGTQRLARIAGRAAALELCLSGKAIDAERAATLGLVNEVTTPDALDAAVDRWADDLASRAPLAAAAIIDTIIHGEGCALEQALRYETAQFALAFGSADAGEGMTAFIERRAPDFSGE